MFAGVFYVNFESLRLVSCFISIVVVVVVGVVVVVIVENVLGSVWSSVCHFESNYFQFH